MELKIGDKVILKSTGASYPTITCYGKTQEEKDIYRYFASRKNRFINVRRMLSGNFTIYSGYDEPYDLSNWKELTWTVKFVIPKSISRFSNDFNRYIITSNKGHVLYIGERGVEKVH